MIRLGAGVVLALLLTAACGGGEKPAAAPSPKPAASPPSGFVAHSLVDVTFHVPRDWVRVPAQQNTGVQAGKPELALRAPGPEGQPAPVVLALLDPQPKRGALKEVDSLVRIKRDVHKVAGVKTDPLALPGFAQAVVVSYDEEVGAETQHTDVLVAELADGRVVTVTVKAERGRYTADELSAITRTVSAASTS